MSGARKDLLAWLRTQERVMAGEPSTAHGPAFAAGGELQPAGPKTPTRAS